MGRTMKVRALRAKKSTSKADTTFGEDLIEATKEAIAWSKGERPHFRVSVRTVEGTPPPTWDQARVQKVRKGFNLSQAAFAEMLNVSAPTVRSWEQGKRIPDGPSARLLEVAELRPDAFRPFLQARSTAMR